MVLASAAYFLYIAVVSLLPRRLTWRRRTQALAAAAGGFALTWLTAATTAFWLHSFVLPLALLLAAYWTCGLLWTGPMLRIERLLEAFDVRLGLPALATRLPRSLCELLELAYVGVYPLIPIGFLVHMAYVPDADAERFWTVVLVTDYVCFGMLPWIQTRAPRMLTSDLQCRSRVRPLNLELLGRLSIGMNTVPSGHAAEALAIALLLSSAPWPLAAAAWTAALGVSAGAVLGRYHFALDAITGWLVALIVWMQTTSAVNP
jgi:hypothetical protein